MVLWDGSKMIFYSRKLNYDNGDFIVHMNEMLGKSLIVINI